MVTALSPQQRYRYVPLADRNYTGPTTDDEGDLIPTAEREWEPAPGATVVLVRDLQPHEYTAVQDATSKVRANGDLFPMYNTRNLKALSYGMVGIENFNGEDGAPVTFPGVGASAELKGAFFFQMGHELRTEVALFIIEPISPDQAEKS